MASRFRPTFWPTLFTIPTLILLLGLGLWQVQRLGWKLDLIALMQERATGPAADLPVDFGDDREAWNFRRATVTGQFDHTHEMFLNGRSHGGSSGYHVITPLIRADGQGAVLVDRGWIPYESRNPATRADGQVEGTVTVEGLLYDVPPRPWAVPDDDVVKNVWFHRDVARMAAYAGLTKVAPLVLEATVSGPPGRYPIGRPDTIELNNPHLEYAVTWFGLALALAVIYLIYHWRPMKDQSQS
jgi:surfeit locus 1 family protein